MRSLSRTLMVCMVLALGFAMAGCGVDGPPPPAAGPDSVTGIAAVGKPIRGRVILRDSSRFKWIRTTVTNADGSYFINVKGLTPPFMVKVEWEDGNATMLKLHSIATNHGRANINPLSDVIVTGVTGTDPTTVFDSNDPAQIEAAAARIAAAVKELQIVLAPMFELYGADKDPIKDDFEADHTGLDALFDDVRIYVAQGMIIVRNKKTNGLIFSAPINDMSAGTFYQNNLPVQPGTLDGPALYAANCAGCHGALAGSTKLGATAAAIQNAISANAGGMGSLSTLTALEIQTIAAALAATMPPTTPEPCTYTYDAWGACQADGTQARNLLTATPAGCTGTPVLSQTCAYVPPPTTPEPCTYTYGPWGTCQADGTQARNLLTASPGGCVGTPVLTQNCTYVPPPTTPEPCTYTYDAWGACQADGTQTRNLLTATPSGCTGTPVLTQTCTYVPPVTTCGTCHAIPPATGRHARHTSFATCATCHGTGYSSTTTNAATHANGVKDIASTPGWNATTQTCTNTCHGSKAW